LPLDRRGDGHIVIANEQDHGHVMVCQPFDSTRKLPLKGGIGTLILVDITGQDTHINLTFQRQVDGLAQSP
jgi:hypothetical protein